MDRYLTKITKYAILRSMDKICNIQECDTPVKFKAICSRHQQLKKREERRRMCIEQLGGKCVRCASTDNLEFDHIDPATKNFNIGEGLSRRLDGLLEELELCQILCRKCHIAKSREELHTSRRCFQQVKGAKRNDDNYELIISKMTLSV